LELGIDKNGYPTCSRRQGSHQPSKFFSLILQFSSQCPPRTFWNFGVEGKRHQVLI